MHPFIAAELPRFDLQQALRLGLLLRPCSQNARKVRAADLRGLRTFRQDYPEAEAALLHRSEKRPRIDGIWCLPVEDFLRGLRPNRELLRG